MVLAPIAVYGDILALVKAILELVKLVAAFRDQYSEELIPVQVVPSADPPEPEVNASTVAVDVPPVVVGLTKASGR